MEYVVRCCNESVCNIVLHKKSEKFIDPRLGRMKKFDLI